MKNILIALLLILGVTVSRAQIHSAAFDPNCYQPTIGTPGVIDTIMGSRKGQQLGGGLINIGPSPDNPGGPGRLMFSGLTGEVNLNGGTSYSAVTMGPSFDPHKMTVAQFKGFLPGSTLVFGHFRSKQYLDIYSADSSGSVRRRPRIYLQTAEGNYDTSLYSTLDFPRKILGGAGSQTLPYHAYLTSDTVEDLVILYAYHTDFIHDTLFYAHFVGGTGQFQDGQKVLPTEEIYFDSAHNFNHMWSSPDVCYVADFRGTGRLDCVATNNSGDLFFYKNDPPFSLSTFVSAMHDTLLSVEQDLRIGKAGTHEWAYYGIAMPAYHNSGGAADMIFLLDSGRAYNSAQLRIFRGGPTFGSHLLTIDSADFILRCPTSYDSNSFYDEAWPQSITDCGDMTGTGNNVLCVGGMGLTVGLYNFYVLGDAIDDKIDMYFGEGYAWGSADTCTLDGDGLQDIAIGAPQFNSEASADDARGTVLFVHGSRKIPVRLNREVIRKTNPALEGRLTVSPNPCARHTVVTWESACSGSVHLRLRDLLGKEVFEETRATTGDLESFSLDLPPLVNGDYFLELQQEPCSQMAKIVVKN